MDHICCSIPMVGEGVAAQILASHGSSVEMDRADWSDPEGCGSASLVDRLFSIVLKVLVQDPVGTNVVVLIMMAGVINYLFGPGWMNFYHVIWCFCGSFIIGGDPHSGCDHWSGPVRESVLCSTDLI